MSGRLPMPASTFGPEHIEVLSSCFSVPRNAETGRPRSKPELRMPCIVSACLRRRRAWRPSRRSRRLGGATDHAGRSRPATDTTSQGRAMMASIRSSSVDFPHCRSAVVIERYGVTSAYPRVGVQREQRESADRGARNTTKRRRRPRRPTSRRIRPGRGSAPPPHPQLAKRCPGLTPPAACRRDYADGEQGSRGLSR